MCPPLCRWAELQDGTYDLTDVQDMHSVMDEMIHQRELNRG